MTLSPRESGAYVASLSTHVKIKQDGIEKLAGMVCRTIESGDFVTLKLTQYEFHPKPDDPLALDWLLVASTLSYHFLLLEGQTNRHRWRVEGRAGSIGLFVALSRALRENPNFFKPQHYSKLTENELSGVLRSDNDVIIPLLSDRVKQLRLVGSILMEKFDGSFEKFVEKSNQSAEKLLEMIVNNFECFRDEVFYKGKNLAFHKRAQLLIGDIWTIFKGEGIGRFTDIEKITMSASYRIPQVLVFFGALKYTAQLMKKIRDGIPLDYGGDEEVEIRGCSLHVIELLKNLISERFPDENVSSIELDRFLWNYRMKIVNTLKRNNIPCHRTHSTYY